MSFNIKKYLDNFYDIDILKYDDIVDHKKYDCFISFSPVVLPKNVPNEKIICGLSSFKSYQNVIKLLDFKYVFTNNIDLFN